MTLSSHDEHAAGGEGCRLEVKEAKILSRKAAPWAPEAWKSTPPTPSPTVKHLWFTIRSASHLTLCFISLVKDGRIVAIYHRELIKKPAG